MAKVSQTIDNLFNGVSRQPQSQRHPSLADEQINMLTVAGRKLSRRPPMEHIAKVMSTTTGYASAFAEEIRRSDDERYIFIVINGDLKVFDAEDGSELTVHFPNAKGYLATATDGFRSVTIGDRTVLVNRSVTTQRGTTKSDAPTYEALIYVRQGDYDTRYKIGLDLNSVTHTTPTTGRDQIATDEIATDLETALNAVGAISSNFTITRFGSTLHVERTDGADFVLSTFDGLGDVALVPIKGKVQRFSDLPLKAKPGFIVEITGDDNTEFDNYFVRYTEDGTPGEAGVWEEVVQPDSVIAFDRSTMPHVLDYLGSFLDDDVAQGDAPVAPTISNGSGNARVVTLVDGDIYPPGATIGVSVSPQPPPPGPQQFTYTNSGGTYLTAAQMSAGLLAVVDAHGDWVATAVDSWSFSVVSTPDVAFNASGSATYDSTTLFANSELVMVANEHVGRTLRNITDGSEAEIVSNTIVSFVTEALAGGSDNTYAPGDLCNVVGTGTYFIFKEAPLASRQAGTLTTVPFPSFTEKTISDVFEHQGRLGFLSGPNVTLSQAGTDHLFNFFRQTATQQLADDVIDLNSTLGSAPKFDSARNWNEVLLLQSDKGQFVLSGEPVFAPNTVSLKLKSEYQSLPGVPPVILGSSAFFAATRSNIALVRDLRVRGAEQVATADDVTQHVPGYIVGTPIQLKADDTQGLVFVLTDDRDAIYMYSTEYDGEQRVRAAWSKWTLGDTSEIVRIMASHGIVFILTKDDNGIFLNRIMLDQDSNPAFVDFGEGHVHMDRLVTQDTTDVTTSYVAGVTTWILPYSVSSADATMKVVKATAAGLEVLSTLRPADDRVAVIGDYSGDDVYIGVCYTSRYRLSRFFRRDQSGAPDLRGVLKLSWLVVRYEDTMDLTVSLTDDRTEWTLDGSRLLDGSVRLLETREHVVASLDEETAELRMFLGARAEHATLDIINDAPTPMTLVSVSWDGEQHDSRGSRF